MKRVDSADPQKKPEEEEETRVESLLARLEASRKEEPYTLYPAFGRKLFADDSFWAGFNDVLICCMPKKSICSIPKTKSWSSIVPMRTRSTDQLNGLVTSEDDYATPLKNGVIMLLIEDLYRDHPASVFRQMARQEIERQDRIGDLIYGEVSFLTLAAVLRKHLPQCTSGSHVFYDLGSGAGRSVFAAAMLVPTFTHIHGIEIIRDLVNCSKGLLQLYEHEVVKELPKACEEQTVTFQEGDILKVDWSDGDVILANSTCFSKELMASMEERAGQIVKQGALVITLTHAFNNMEKWELLDSSERRQSWGPAVVHVQRRR